MAILLVVGLLTLRWRGSESTGAQATEAPRTLSRTAPTAPSDSSSSRHEQAPKRTESQERFAINLSSADVNRAFKIRDEAREFLKNAELKRAEVFCQTEDAEGNSSSTVLLKRPDEKELTQLFEDYLGSLSDENREFVAKSGLSASFQNEIADFFAYEKQYRYVSFRLAGDGSTELPTVMVIESDRYYDKQLAAEGKLDVPWEEMNIPDFGNLEVGNPRLDRYGKLFSIKKDN